MKPQEKYFQTHVDLLKKADLYPTIHTVTGPSSEPMVEIEGEKFLNFCSNNYLGLAQNKEVEEVCIEGIKKYGVGSGSTRMLSGTLDVQVAFEKELADFFGFEDAITFSSGYMANIGVIRMLVDPFPYAALPFEAKGIIISDELNHASIIDGVRLSKSERAVYAHNDMKELEDILKKSKGKRKLILTDGVFSMDGDLAKLKEITQLAKEYEALVMVDDSHAVGVLGGGVGTAKYLGVEKDIDILMGSFTKGFGSIGGFIATSKTIGDYLRITSRSYIFSDPIIPSVVASLQKTLSIIKEGEERRTTVLENAEYLRSELKKAGFTVLGEVTSIVPLFIGSEKKAIQFYDALYKAHILAPCIRRPAVEPGRERIRFSLMATHTKEQVDELLKVCKEINENFKMGLIKK